MSGTAGGAACAIVVGRGYTALGAMRCLSMAGIPVFVACPKGDIATRSRWYRPAPGANPWHGELGDIAEKVLAEMPLQKTVLIPAADDVALWASGLPRSLTDRFHVSTSSPQTLEILQDKALFGAWLKAHGIPCPRTYTVETESDLGDIPFAEIEKVFIKPVDSQQFSQRLGIKAMWVANRAEFETTWQRLRRCGLRIMAQEYIPGGFDDHYFIDGFRDYDGNFTGRFARRRRRIYPSDFGNSSYCESIPFDEVESAWESLSKMLSLLEYRGIFSAEFKRDSRDGKFKILEVNTRAWWYVEFAARCGVNVCRMAFEDAQRLPVASAQHAYAVGEGCLNFPGDIKAVCTAGRHRRDPVPAVLAQWLCAHYLVFRFDDPVPGLIAFHEVVANVVKSRMNRMFRCWKRSVLPVLHAERQKEVAGREEQFQVTRDVSGLDEDARY